MGILLNLSLITQVVIWWRLVSPVFVTGSIPGFLWKKFGFQFIISFWQAKDRVLQWYIFVTGYFVWFFQSSVWHFLEQYCARSHLEQNFIYPVHLFHTYCSDKGHGVLWAMPASVWKMWDPIGVNIWLYVESLLVILLMDVLSTK